MPQYLARPFSWAIAVADKVNGNFVRTTALQPQNFAAPLINDRFSRGIAAVAGCVPRKKYGLCKVRKLRTADLGAQRSMWAPVC